MATTKRHGKPYVWVSWITGLLSGANQCEWALWYKSHFKYDKQPSDFDLTAWGADHDALVRRHVQALTTDGWSCTVENKNGFHLHGQTAILAGKPDIIARKQGQSLRIADGKTGAPNKKDWWQMLVYLFALPKAWKRPDLRMHAQLVYRTHQVIVEPEELTRERQKDIARIMLLAASDIVPTRTPSASECPRCDIADCPDRFVAQPAEVLTTEF